MEYLVKKVYVLQNGLQLWSQSMRQLFSFLNL